MLSELQMLSGSVLRSRVLRGVRVGGHHTGAGGGARPVDPLLSASSEASSSTCCFSTFAADNSNPAVISLNSDPEERAALPADARCYE